MIKLLQEDRAFKLADIHVGDRLRGYDEDAARGLVTSWAEIGQKDPIDLRWIKRKKRYELLDGRHRIGVAQLRGETTIWAKVWECNDSEAELIEIDGQIGRADLTALDTAVFLAARKRLYLKMHPEMGQGGFRGNQHTGNLVPDIVSFTTSTAQKFGKTERQVRRWLFAGERLGPDEASRLRQAPKPVTMQDLEAISRISSPPDRYDVVNLLAKGEAKNAADAVRQVKAARGEGPAPKDPTDAGYSRLSDAWTRGNKAARKRFAEEHRDELRAILDEIGGDDE
ncbi:hypothetical protein A9320_24810 [Ruegeria sp. PBVC088]|nr:hypothetical protein A9320_24810 [Ruegeria sp. PBVC088]